MQLNPVQLELIKLFSFQSLDEQDLQAIKKLLTAYLSQKLVQEADKVWDKEEFSNELMDEWLNEDNQE
ncbi:MAG: hypothetical protein HC913_09120 [Microscillaceae bacterium]|nr:hypothetical protein [Microscillaceae bacterium]